MQHKKNIRLSLKISRLNVTKNTFILDFKPVKDAFHDLVLWKGVDVNSQSNDTPPFRAWL